MTKSITYEVTVTPEYTKYELNDKRHREDGPAVVYTNGDQHWYINGKEFTEAAFKKEMAKCNKPSCAGKVVEIDGVKYTLTKV